MDPQEENEMIEEILIDGNTKFMKNNRALFDPFNAPGFPIISTIFQNHPLMYLLTVQQDLAEVYLYEMWRSIHFVQPAATTKRKHKSPELRQQGHFVYQLNSEDKVFEFEFNLDDFRRILRIPEADFNGHKTYDEFESHEVMLAAIISLGYEGPLTKTKDFKLKNLPKIWYYVYSILSNCLTPYTRGMDNLSQPMLYIFYGVVFNKHYDIAQLLWDQLIVLVNGKRSAPKKYIPFIRFLTAMVYSKLRQNKSIPRLHNRSRVFIHSYRYVRDSGIANYTFLIPSFLLDMVPDNHEDKKAYLDWIRTTMGSENLPIPSQVVLRSPGEGSKRKRKEREGESSLSKKKGKKQRITKVVIKMSRPVVQQKKKTLKRKADIASSEETESANESPVPIRSPPPKTTTVSPTISRSPSPRTPSPERQTLPKSPIHQSSPLPSISSPVQPLFPQPISIVHQSSPPLIRSPPLTYFQGRKKAIYIRKKFKKSRFEYDRTQETEIEPDLTREKSASDDDATQFADEMMDFTEEQGGFEGGVENTREDVWSGLGTEQKKRVGSPIVETDVTSRELTIRIEDENFPISHAQASTSHSDSSKQESVSQIHGDDKPRSPHSPHSEDESVEQREDQPHLSPSFDTLESSLPKNTEFHQAQLSTDAGTSREGPTVCDLRGPLGSPTLANIMPALAVGNSPLTETEEQCARFGDTAISHDQPETVLTGILSDPGVVIAPIDSGCEAESSTAVHTFEPAGNPETVMMSSGHASVSLETSSVPTPSFSLTPEAQRLISQFVEGIEEGQTSVLRAARYSITGKLPETEPTPVQPTRLLTGGPLRIGPPVVSQTPTPTPQSSQPIISSSPITETAPIVQITSSTPPEIQTTSPQRSFSDPDSSDSSSSSSSSSESESDLSDSYFNSFSAARLHESSLSTDTLITAVLHRLQSEQPNLNSPKQIILHSILSYKQSLESEAALKAENEALQKRIRELEQQCRPATISRSRDDQEPDDQPEGENIEDSGEGHHTTQETSVQETVQDLPPTQTSDTSDIPSSSQAQDQHSDSDNLPPLLKYISHYYSTTSSDQTSDPDPFQPGNGTDNDEDSSDSDGSNDAPPQPAMSQECFEKDIFDEIIYDLRDTYNFDTPRELSMGVRHPRINPNKIWQINEGYFHENYAQMIDLNSKPEELVCRARYIEERAFQIFCSSEERLNMTLNRLRAFFLFRHQDQRDAYLEMMNEISTVRSEEWFNQFKYPITRVLTLFAPIKYLNQRLVRFRVLRADGHTYVVHEESFQHLPVSDILFLYNQYAHLIMKTPDQILAYEALKSHIQALIRFYEFNDFQIGLERRTRRINLTRPIQRAGGYELDSFQIGDPIEELDGFVFINSFRGKIFIRASDFPKYSDGTLKYCLFFLKAIHENPDPNENEDIQVQRERHIRRIQETIDMRQRIRDLIAVRTVKPQEGVIHTKTGSWVRWNPSHERGPHNIPPVDFQDNIKLPDERPEGDNWHFIPKKFWNDSWNSYKKRAFWSSTTDKPSTSSAHQRYQKRKNKQRREKKRRKQQRNRK